MNAAATRARVRKTLLLALALSAMAAPARAQESAPAADTAPVPETAALAVEQALDRAELQIDEAMALRQEPDPAPESTVAPPSDPPEASAEAEPPVETSAPSMLLAVPTPAEPAPPAAEPELPPDPTTRLGVQPVDDGTQSVTEQVLTLELETVEPKSRPAPERQREPEPTGRADRPRLVTKLDTRLRAVEQGVRKVRRQLDAGREPPPPLLRKLRRSVDRLQAALSTLERDVAGHAAPLAGLHAIAARLRRARAAASGLVAALGRDGQVTPAARALIHELVAFGIGRAAHAPVRAVRRRSHDGRPLNQDSAPAAAAYTQQYAPQPQAQSGSGAETRRSPARAERAPESPPGFPWALPAPFAGAAAGVSGQLFSVAGPAVLALLLGLAIPRLLWRLARLPVCRPPESFVSPRERPG